MQLVANAQSDETVRRAGRLRSDLQYGRIDEILATGLHGCLQGVTTTVGRPLNNPLANGSYHRCEQDGGQQWVQQADRSAATTKAILDAARALFARHGCADLRMTGRSVPTGASGEITIKGPQVMAGYWQRADETAQVMTHDGYFKTGDIGTMDEQGYIHAQVQARPTRSRTCGVGQTHANGRRKQRRAPRVLLLLRRRGP
jgi:acyl-CoA synthetase (AMP-forming)/AMP-acid ligase II